MISAFYNSTEDSCVNECRRHFWCSHFNFRDEFCDLFQGPIDTSLAFKSPSLSKSACGIDCQTVPDTIACVRAGTLNWVIQDPDPAVYIPKDRKKRSSYVFQNVNSSHHVTVFEQAVSIYGEGTLSSFLNYNKKDNGEFILPHLLQPQGQNKNKNKNINRDLPPLEISIPTENSNQQARVTLFPKIPVTTSTTTTMMTGMDEVTEPSLTYAETNPLSLMYQEELKNIPNLLHASNSTLIALLNITRPPSLTYNLNTTPSPLANIPSTTLRALTYDPPTTLKALTYDPPTTLKALTYETSTLAVTKKPFLDPLVTRSPKKDDFLFLSTVSKYTGLNDGKVNNDLFDNY